MKYVTAFVLLGSLSLGLLFLGSPSLAATVDENIQERQKLIFFTSDAYAVLSSENESTSKPPSRISRASIKTYHLETNELLGTSILSEHLVVPGKNGQETTFTDIRDSTQPTSIVVNAADKVMVEHSINISGDFALDDEGIYFKGDEAKKYVVPMNQIWHRVKWPVNQFSVVRMHRETIGEQLRYFLILRSDDYGQKANTNDYELVISLPENY